MTKAPAPLPLYLGSAYVLLAIYGSLYPLDGWHNSGVPLTDYLWSGWPRYTTHFDIGSNIAAYLPMGFLWVAAFRQRLSLTWAVTAAAALGALLSFSLETLQNFLPSRVPSNLDLACNSAGTLLGALAGARWGATMLDGGRLHAIRHRLFNNGRIIDVGLLLAGLWLLTQLNPDTLLFGNGDLRSLFDLSPPLPYSAEDFPRIEAIIVGAHTLAIALSTTLLARPGRFLLAPALLLAGLAAKSFAFLLIMNGADGLAWATSGSLSGLAAGTACWLLILPLPGRWRQALASLALLVATTLVNLAPENPYLVNTFQVWNPGQFLNFHGLTRLTSILWPFLVLPWLIFLRTDHAPRNP